MTGNVPNAVRLSPRWLFTFRFTVHTQGRMCTVSDLTASQVSSVKSIWGAHPQLRARLVSWVQRQRQEELTRTANPSRDRLGAGQKGPCPSRWVHPDRDRRGVNLNCNETSHKADKIALFIGKRVPWRAGTRAKSSLNCRPELHHALVLTSAG